MDFGQLLAGAGVVGQAWRKEEEAQRRAYEQEQEAKHFAYLRELQRAELERQERLRQEALQQPLPSFSFNPPADAGMPVFDTKNQPTTTPTAPATLNGVQTFALPPASEIEVRNLSETDSSVSQNFDTLRSQLGALVNERARLEKELPLRWLPFAEHLYSADDYKKLIRLQELEKQINRLKEQMRATSVPLAQEEYAKVNPQYAEQKKQKSKQAQQQPQTTQTPQLSYDVNRLLQAVIQVESGGDPNARSVKNAIGLMQIRPETAMNPGLGVPDIFIVAKRVGEKVSYRTKAEAERLLRNPKVNVAFGTAYLQALLSKYNGNLEYALAAYNAGPTFVDKWVKGGADFTKLPKETRGYIAKVTALLNQEGTDQSAGLSIPDVSAIKVAQTENTYIDPSKFYLANPQSIPLDIQRALQQRNEVVRMAEMYRNAGMGLRYLEARNKLMELDNGIIFLHGMQGLQEFALANDPRRLAWVWSQYAGVPVGIQPRTDGKFNIFVNGQKVKEALDSATISDMARRAFDQTYQARQAEASAEVNKLLMQSQLRIAEENAKQQAQMVREIYVERAKGDIQRALKMLEQVGFDAKPLGDGSNALIITPRDGRSLPFIFYPDGIDIDIDGTKVKTYYRILQYPGY